MGVFPKLSHNYSIIITRVFDFYSSKDKIENIRLLFDVALPTREYFQMRSHFSFAHFLCYIVLLSVKKIGMTIKFPLQLLI